MMKLTVPVLAWLLAMTSYAAELNLDFGGQQAGDAPTNFASLVTGEGKPGNWKILLDNTPSQMPALTPQAATNAKRPVIAQTAQDATDEHFPLLIFNGGKFGDFTLTTRFKIISGTTEQMAGVAFRIQDEKNYYVIRASALGGNFRFYKFVNGQRSAPIGPDVPVSLGEWHELKVQCQGNQIICWLDGRDVLPPLNDSSFSAGKIGFWTKSDSVTYFTDTHLTYTPKEAPVQAAARDVLKQYKHLRNLKIFAPKNGDASHLIAVAAADEADLGQAGADAHQQAFTREKLLYAKVDGNVSLIQPLRDRNGETIGVLELTMESFLWQTEQNAVQRALPIVKSLQLRVQDAKDLFN